MCRSINAVLAFGVASLLWPVAGNAQVAEIGRDSVRIQMTDVDLRAAIQALGRYLDKPVVTADFGEVRIPFFETPVPVSRAQVRGLLQGLVESRGLGFREDSLFYSILPTENGIDAPEPVEARIGAVQLFHVRLRHARAGDVAAVLNQLFGSGGAFQTPVALRQLTLSQGLREDVSGAPRSPDQRMSDLETQPGTVLVVPDEATNSLLIRATHADFAALEEAIQSLDTRPLQVLIEVTVVEARKDRQFSLGFDAEMPAQSLGNVGGSVSGSLAGAGLGDLVVTVMKLGRLEVNARLTAARLRGDVNILSRPVLLASNNVEATLMVGTQRPFIQVSRSLPTDTPQRDQVVQYRDVGTKLTILPTINADGFVSLAVQQEVSAATGETQFGAPIISSREATTRALVADRQTIVIGGLRDRIQEEVRTGIPVLADIPLLGGLFGDTRLRDTETELFLFITPTVLRDDEESRRATDERLPDILREPGDSLPGVAGATGPGGT